jgi:anaerobic selenocysteine-containing dehydrogenase
MMLALEHQRVGLLWIAATNPAVSLPDLNRTKAALRQSPFTIYQDAYYPTETAEFAHLLLPAAQWGEKTGTMTNSERVVTLCPAFRPPPGEARPTGKFLPRWAVAWALPTSLPLPTAPRCTASLPSSLAVSPAT